MQPGRPQASHIPSPFTTSAPSSAPPLTHPLPSVPVPAPTSGGYLGSTERGRGRGRGGATRGAGRGGSGGVGAPPFARHQNLSWRKPAEGPSTDTASDDQGAPAPAAANAFSAFGNAAPQASAFGSTGGASAFGSFGAPGAFGAPPMGSVGTGASAFGGGAFSASTSAPLSSTSAPMLAFAAPSAFGPVSGPPSSAPLFRQPSSQDGTEPDEEEGIPEDEPYGEAAEEENEEDEQDEEDEEEDEAVPAPAPTAKRVNGQISTLEVLGEDSDARKKRFEATLPNNRYLELKPLREAQRIKAIKAGLIPDPSKPMRLDQATDFEGTCDEMCPEWEREEREYQNNVDPLERYPGTTRIDPARAVKAFHRPAAGNDQPLPSDVRPPPTLERTLDYLFHTLLPTLPLATTHPFIRDRTRSIRQDFTVQNIRGRSAIECNERIARYHILAVGTLREQTGFSESQELEQLRKVLKSLNEFYDDARASGNTAPSPNEAEFRAYHLLTHLRDPDIVWSTELLPHALFAHPLLQRALALHRLAQRARIPRGERAAPGAFARFFKLISDQATPYLFACILSTHFADVRKGAIEALRGAFLQQHSALPLATLTRMLGCDDETEARSVCEQFGLVVRTDENGVTVAEIHKQAVLKTTTLKPHVSLRLVEAKRGSTSFQDVIDCGASGSAVVKAPPAVSRTAALPRDSAFNKPPVAARTSGALSGSAPAFTFAPRPAGRSPIPTPFDSPALGPTPASNTPQNGLNATAPSFVPSFSLPVPAVSTTASTRPTSATLPSPAAPASVAPNALSAAAPTFSFASSSGALPLPSAATLAASAPTAPSTRPPSSSLPRTAVSAAPFVPASTPLLTPVAPPPHAPRPSLSSASRRSPSMRRASLVHAPARSPHLDHPAHAAEAPYPSATSAAAVAARAQRVEALAKAICEELLAGTLVRAVAGRAAAEALKERWAQVRKLELRERDKLVEVAAKQVQSDLGRLAVREAVLCGRRDETRRTEAWSTWRKALAARREWKAQQQEKKRLLEDVMRGIEREREDERAEADDDDIISDSDDDDESGDNMGIAGLADAGLDFGGLSLGGIAKGARIVNAAESDLASRVREAAVARERIWQRGTFLNSLASTASTAIANLVRPLPTRPTWTTLVVVEEGKEPFAAWLACKLDLQVRSGTAEVDAPSADIEVRMLSRGDEPVASELESTGAIMFDCTTSRSKPVDWTASRARLYSLVSRVSARSLFRPAVLVLLCPDRTLSPAESSALRDKTAEELQLSTLEGGGGGKARVWIARFEGAEAEFDAELRLLLEEVQVREERIPRPMSFYWGPLVQAWQRSLARAFALLRDQEAAPMALSAYLEPLKDIMREIEDVASPSPRSRLTLPQFDIGQGTSFLEAVERYIASSQFRSVGHFPDLAVALAQRPPMSDLAVARSTLEHLSQFADSMLEHLRVPSGVIGSKLPEAMERLSSALAAIEVKLRPRSPAPTPPATPKRVEGTASKKRRASAAPTTGGVSSPKKLNASAAGDERDRLSALEGLMKDARALLAL